MSERTSPLAQRKLWAWLVGLAAMAFWVVALGVGIRGWILTDDSLGIVAHTEGFGRDAMPWMIVASILTLTTASMGIGIAVVRHLAEGSLDGGGGRVSGSATASLSRRPPGSVTSPPPAVAATPGPLSATGTEPRGAGAGTAGAGALDEDQDEPSWANR